MSFYELPEPTVVTGPLDGGKFGAPPSSNVSFRDVVARAVDFSDADYTSLTCRSSRFELCNFDRIRVVGGPFGLYPQSLFRECTFRDAEFRGTGADPGLARFERCSFDGATIEEWFTHCAEFVECTFAGARIVGSNFFGTPFECYGWLELRHRRKQNEFYGNDFSEAELINTSFVDGIDLDAQRLPAGPEYVRINNAKSRIEEARAQIASWDDAAARREATSVLNVLEHFSESKQRDLLTRRDTWELDPDLDGQFWDLLATKTGEDRAAE
jgi:hypothetical protein